MSPRYTERHTVDMKKAPWLPELRQDIKGRKERETDYGAEEPRDRSKSERAGKAGAGDVRQGSPASANARPG